MDAVLTTKQRVSGVFSMSKSYPYGYSLQGAALPVPWVSGQIAIPYTKNLILEHSYAITGSPGESVEIRIRAVQRQCKHPWRRMTPAVWRNDGLRNQGASNRDRFLSASPHLCVQRNQMLLDGLERRREDLLGDYEYLRSAG